MVLFEDSIYQPRVGAPGGVATPFTPNAGGPKYGEGAPIIKTRQFALDTAQSIAVEIDVAGNFIWAFTASDLSASINVQFNDQINEPIPVTSGFGLGGPKFGKLYISWAAQAGKTLTLMFGLLPDISNFFINAANALNSVNVAGVVAVSVAKEAAILSTADLAVTVVPGAVRSGAILAANTKRKYAMITAIAVSGNFAGAPASGATDFRICELANTTVVRGQPLGQSGTVTIGVGTTLILETTAAISYVGIATAVNGLVTLALLEIQDS